MQENQKTARVFSGGVPTDIDVRLLNDQFGVPAVGRLIEYAEIEKIIGHKKDTHRFKTVVNQWRKNLYRDHNVVFEVRQNEGYIVADPRARVALCARKSGNAVRQITRASTIAERTDETGLDTKQKMLRRHLANRGALVRLAIATSADKMSV